MKRYLVVGETKVEGERLYVKHGESHWSLPLSIVEAIEDRQAVDLTGKSMHQIGLMLEARNTQIGKLIHEVNQLKIGGQPASKLRDAIVPVLLNVQDMLKDGSLEIAGKTLARLIENVKSIPSLEPPLDKNAEARGVKPYKPLDHGPRDDAAAAPEHRRVIDQAADVT